MAVVFKRTEGLQDVATHYCPGCTHGIIHRLVAESLEEMGLLENAIGVVPVGSSIGMAEIVHAAARGEKISTIFVNNGIYGMTGGQMAPTTLIGQKATTAQNGRDPEINGFPIRVSEMLATLTGAVFVERVSVDTPANVRKAKKAIKKAFQVQQAGLGFGIVEVLSSCPTNWGLAPKDALQWLRDNMMSYYELGNKKDIEVEVEEAK